MADTPIKDRDLTDSEIAKRRDEVLGRMLQSPPKPHAEIAGKGKSKKKPTGKRKPNLQEVGLLPLTLNFPRWRRYDDQGDEG